MSRVIPANYYLLTTGRRSGQVMILTVLALGGTILGATTIAGLLMLYQIRQTTDLGSSAKAIFAADAGIEKGFYDLLCKGNDDKKNDCPAPELVFTNGASVDVKCYDEDSQPLEDCANSNVRHIRSVGTAGNASRAFEASF